MIPYLEILDKYTLKKLAPVEPQECWFELSYQDVGEFEVYCRATQKNLQALQKGRYVKIPNKRFIWVITAIRYTLAADGARMISAKGYEAKWLLNKRCILTPKELQGTITTAVYGLVNHALGTGANAARTISDNKGNYKFFVGTNDLLIDISGTQATRGNLLEFVNNLLKAYNCGSIVEYENETLVYKIFTGAVKTQSVKFSQSLDNLLSSDYLTDDGEAATSALVVSTVEDIDYTQDYDTGETGIDRAEIVVSSNLSTKYETTNENGEVVEEETTPTSELYKGWQREEGKTKLTEHITKEEANGEIDIANSKYRFDKDFFIGDMIRVQDEYFNFFIDTRVSKYTFKQDANGYGEEAEYGGKQ